MHLLCKCNEIQILAHLYFSALCLNRQNSITVKYKPFTIVQHQVSANIKTFSQTVILQNIKHISGYYDHIVDNDQRCH